MEVSLSKCDEEEKALMSLLEVFGSLFSLEQIASAYCKAGRNADLAGQILYETPGRTHVSSTYASDGEERCEVSSVSSTIYASEKSCHVNGKFQARKKKYRPVSGGTISSVLGKDYVKFTPVVNGSSMAMKPMKLDSKVLPMSWEEENKLNSSNNDRTNKEMEDFLFEMLGDDFQMERDVIRQVLDKSGYHLQKSMDKLLDLSAMTLDDRSTCLGKPTEMFTDACPSSEELHSRKELQSKSSTGSIAKVSKVNEEELSQQEKERDDMQKEVLAALFSADERSEALMRKKAQAARRAKFLGELVVEPPRDITLEHKAESVDSQQNIDNGTAEDEEDDYQLLRRAVKEYRGTMKEYYKAAVHAFAKGDHDRAHKLMDKGHFFHEKARDADEESSRKIFETKNTETQNEISLELHDHGAKEAIRLLKCHLSSLSGIPSIKYLKVVIEKNEEDVLKGSRRRLIMKLLEKESITWSEAGDAGAILIHLDNINPKRLSFAKK